MPPTLLVISFTDLARDPRVNRQLRFLREDYRVLAAGTGDPGLEGVRFVPLEPPPTRRGLGRWSHRLRSGLRLATRRFERYYWRAGAVPAALERLRGLRPDAVLANDIDTLPLVLRLFPERPVVYDAHEYAPREFEDRLAWRALVGPCRTHLCRTYLPRTAGMMTVGPGLAAAYRELCGVDPVIVTNAPDYEPELRPTRVGSDDGRVRLVHHGYAHPSRRMETMIDVLARLDERFELDFLLVDLPSAAEYTARLRRLAAHDPRIRFRPPVPMRELPRTLNEYDLGFYLLPPSNFNQRFMLPNKLFEFVQARLGLAISPSPEMARVVREHGCGVVAADFSPAALAQTLRGLDRAAIDGYKAASHRAAYALSAAPNRERVRELVAAALRGP